MDQPSKTPILRGTLLGAATKSTFRWSPLGDVTESLSLGSRSVDEFYPELRVNLGVPSETDYVGSPQSRSPSGRNAFTTANGCSTSKQDKVKVYVRMRPFSESEKVCPLKQVLCLIGETIVVRDLDQKLMGNTKEPPHKAEAIEFKVDYMQDDSYLQVHSEIHKEESQKRMYGALGVPCIESALDGYNTTILAYGQTGSGKTYTMMGDNSKAGRGLIPRLANDLMTKINEESSNGILYTVQVSYLEIYQEKIRDLLADDEMEEEAKPLPVPQPSLNSGQSNNEENVCVTGTKLEEKMTTTSPYIGSLTENSYTSSFLNKAALQRQLEASQKQAKTMSEGVKSPWEKPFTSSSHDGSLNKAKSPMTKPAFDTVFSRQKVHKHYRTFPTVMEEAVPLRKQTFLKIREHPITGPFVEGLLWKDVCSWHDMENLMKQGSTSRTTASTDMNEQSSRSHAVFSIRLTRKLGPDLFGVQPSSLSYINLVDLAGSEKLPKLCSGAVTGHRTQEESRCINRSLSQLNEVILSLSRSSFVSYRNSVLTWLLKESLGGNSRTFMVANISPTEKDLRESINSLRYATTASRIPPPAALDQDPRNKLIKKLKEEICTLRTLLSSFTSMKDNAPSDQLPSMLGFKVPSLDVGLQVEYICSTHDDINLRKRLWDLLDRGSQTENHFADGEHQSPWRSCGIGDAAFQVTVKEHGALNMVHQTAIKDSGRIDTEHETLLMKICASDFGNQASPRDFGVVDAGHQVKLRDLEAVDASQKTLKDCGHVDVGQQMTLLNCKVVDVGNQTALRGWGFIDEGQQTTSQDCGVADAGQQTTWRNCGVGNVGNRTALSDLVGCAKVQQQTTWRACGVADIRNRTTRHQGRVDSGQRTDCGPVAAGSQIISRDCGSVDAGNQVAFWKCGVVDAGSQITVRDWGDVDAGNQITVQGWGNVDAGNQIIMRDWGNVDVGSQITLQNWGDIDAGNEILLRDWGTVDSGQKTTFRHRRAVDVGCQITQRDWRTIDCTANDAGHQTRFHDPGLSKALDGTIVHMHASHQIDWRDFGASNAGHQVTPQKCRALDIGYQVSWVDFGASDNGEQVIWRDFGTSDIGHQTTEEMYPLTSDIAFQTFWTDFGTKDAGDQVIRRKCTSNFGQQKTTFQGCGAIDLGFPIQLNDRDLRAVTTDGSHITTKHCLGKGVGQQWKKLGQEWKKIAIVDQQISLFQSTADDSGMPMALKEMKARDIEKQIDNWQHIAAREDGPQTSLKFNGTNAREEQVAWKDMNAVEAGHHLRAGVVGHQTSLKVERVTEERESQANWKYLAVQGGHQTAVQDCGLVINAKKQANLGTADIGLQTSWEIIGSKVPENQGTCRDYAAVELSCEATFKEYGFVTTSDQSTSTDFGPIASGDQPSLDKQMTVEGWNCFQCGVCGATPGNSMVAVSTLVPIHLESDVGLQTSNINLCASSANELQGSCGASPDINSITLEALGTAVKGCHEELHPLHDQQHPVRRKYFKAIDSKYQTALKACESRGSPEQGPLVNIGAVRVGSCDHWEEHKICPPGCQLCEQDYVVQKWQHQVVQEVGQDCVVHNLHRPAHHEVGHDSVIYNWQNCHELMLSGPTYLVTNSDVDTSKTDEESDWNAAWGRDQDPQISFDDLRGLQISQDVIVKQVRERNVGRLLGMEHWGVDIGIQTYPGDFGIVEGAQQTSSMRWKRINFRFNNIQENIDLASIQTQGKGEDDEDFGATSGTQTVQEDKSGACDFSQQINLQSFQFNMLNEDLENLEDCPENRQFPDGRPGRDQDNIYLPWLSDFLWKKEDSTNVQVEEAFHLCSLWTLAKLRSRMEWYSSHYGRDSLKHSFSLAIKCHERVSLPTVSSKADVSTQIDSCVQGFSKHTTNLSNLFLHVCFLWSFVILRIATSDKVFLREGKRQLVKKSPCLPDPGKIKILNCLSSVAADERHFKLQREYHLPKSKQLHYSGVEPITFKSTTPFFIQSTGDCSLTRTRLNQRTRSGKVAGGLYYKIMCEFQSHRAVHFLKDGVNRLGSDKGAHICVKGLSEDHSEFIYMPAHCCTEKKGYVVARLVAAGAIAFLNGLPMLEHKELCTGDVLVLRDLRYRSSVCTLHFFDLVKYS